VGRQKTTSTKDWFNRAGAGAGGASRTVQQWIHVVPSAADGCCAGFGLFTHRGFVVELLDRSASLTRRDFMLRCNQRLLMTPVGGS
jgi:hypothetical protein